MASFADRFKFIRDHFDLSQADMSEKLKLSRAYISHLETGKRDPSDLAISMICKVFSVSEVWLRTGDGEPFFNASVALQKEFANDFIKISRAFSPVFTAYGEIIPLFESREVMRIYNYVALKIKKGGFTEKNLASLSQGFDTAFPGYAEVIQSLESRSSSLKSTPHGISFTSEMPVSGLAAAGSPIYCESDGDEDRVSVPQQYCNDRFFIVQAKGNSMQPNIMDGDFVVVQRSTVPENGEVALVKIEGSSIDEYAIKVFYQHLSKIELRSYNGSYKPMLLPITKLVSAEKVVHVIHGC